MPAQLTSQAQILQILMQYTNPEGVCMRARAVPRGELRPQRGAGGAAVQTLKCSAETLP